jgi:serine/threonine-protein phosphatase 2A regulatory subunit A|mmetsp:Transcript_4189/g.12213  ORF Transcript_4189/g.12213 Transcript_4189/m.12213 type:complete len:592 (-) Transcript_4189:197-1972(-)
MAGGDFNYLEFFKEEIRNENAAIKIGAVNRLNLIASALGPQRTVSELIPYVTQVVQEEPLCNDEEFLFSMAKQYAVLSDYISGHDELLIAPLEHLAAQEETVIRDQAIQSLCSVVEKKPSLAPEYLVPTLHRLATKTDFFTARVSACALLPTAYRFANEDQKAGLRKAYRTLCAEDTPMVRRAAAHKLRDLISVCDKQDLLEDMCVVYKQLSQEDTQDTIRVACVHTTLVMAQMFNAEENRQFTISVIKDAAEDRSWRVRLTVAKNFDQLCSAFGPEITATNLMQPFIQLMRDGEQEVRKEAVRVIEPCLQLKEPLTSDQLQVHILPQFTSLGLDSAQPVRAALAQVLGPVAKILGRDVTQRQLLSLISDLMKDEFHDVRLNMVSHAGLICEVLSVDGLVHSLLHTIQNLIMDNHWRIRQSVVEQVPKLAQLFGVDMFQSKLEALFLSSLRDSVHSVRQAAIHHLKEIADTFGSEWTINHLLPKLVEQYSQSHGYANRLTTLHLLPQVSGVMTSDQIVQYMIPLLIRATKDSVPNVRFCACRTIMWMMENHSLGATSINTIIKPTLLDLETDSDMDVQYYAGRAMAQCNAN